ncbi:MAG: DNA (cytosine-5-)-methyltransferase, partial [Clostridiales Family XIII bacterium]|nr:DNA (cytosine-5-)-methyltransferase [Clostridiales Family XIII bacterium]
MTKQIHVRLSDKMYDSLSEYATVASRPMQDCVTEALAHLFEVRKAEKTIHAGAGAGASFTFIDLFAGIGGMRIAFEANGGSCVFSSEWDRYCQKTYFDNFGVMPFGDITKIAASDIPDHDVLVAGFPCQPFSIAGVSKKRSLGKETGFLDKTQGTLFFDIVRV